MLDKTLIHSYPRLYLSPTFSVCSLREWRTSSGIPGWTIFLGARPLRAVLGTITDNMDLLLCQSENDGETTRWRGSRIMLLEAGCGRQPNHEPRRRQNRPPVEEISIGCVSQRQWSCTCRTMVPPEHIHRRAINGGCLH